MDSSSLDFEFPPGALAAFPPEERTSARLLIAGPAGPGRDGRIPDLPSCLSEGDVLVLNDSHVRPARILGEKESGGHAEVVVLERRTADTWVALVGARRTPRVGTTLRLPGDCVVEVAGRERELFVLRVEGDLEAALEAHGLPPLPPYLHREPVAADRERYQTLHAVRGDWGTAAASAAAPTAGLHLTPDLLDRVRARGVEVVRVTLGVGAGTFRPIEAGRVEDHRMHDEPFAVPAATARAVNAARNRGRDVVAVGTTSLRALEAAGTPGGRVRAVTGRTGLFVIPGCRLRVVTRLLTNFHQPRSTLLALVMAVAGEARIREIYGQALGLGYRLFSYGDAMLLDVVG